MWRRRLTWYAEDSGIADVKEVGRLLGRDGWRTIVPHLLRVVLPETSYQVFDASAATLRWDERSWRAYCEDLARFPRLRSDERRVRFSRFLFYVAVGISWGMTISRSRKLAWGKLEQSGFGAQRHLLLG
jgi:hypothetical protein